MNPLISMYRAMMQNPNQFMQNMANNNQKRITNDAER